MVPAGTREFRFQFGVLYESPLPISNHIKAGVRGVSLTDYLQLCITGANRTRKNENSGEERITPIYNIWNYNGTIELKLFMNTEKSNIFCWLVKMDEE